MSAIEHPQTARDVISAAAERIRWEMELGVTGYDPSIGIGSTAAPKTEEQPLASHLTPQPRLTEAREPEDPARALEALRQAIGDCTRCNLHRGRTHLVFGEGNPHARLVFVGEGPGRDEDAAGRPFVGAAGQLLDRIIHAMGLRREDVYICNVVKCRPPDNRAPDDGESKICGPFLKRQLAVIRPEVIVALGKTAAEYLLGGPQSITRIRGRFHSVDGTQMMPTFHPAYLLRNPGEKRAVWNDMQMVMGVLGLARKPT